MHREGLSLALTPLLAAWWVAGAQVGHAADVPPANRVGAPAAASLAVEANEAWIRWLPGDLPAAGYVTLRNVGAAPFRLTGAASPDFGTAMLHESRSVKDVERMLPVEALPLGPHGTIRLAPGGYHLMLTDARRSLRPGDRVVITLQFDRALSLPVAFEVRGPDGRPAPASGSPSHP